MERYQPAAQLMRALAPQVEGGETPVIHPNLPLPPAEAERRLKAAPFDFVTAEDTGTGVMGAKKTVIMFRDDELFLDVKWKKAPAGGDGWNNSPRREIGVYEAQKLFLDTADYLVPPVVARAVETAAYRVVEPDACPNLEGVECVYGTLAVWMRGATKPDCLFDRQLFERNLRYAYHFANLNLLHYVVKHRDARSSNFLISTDSDNPQVFSIDNGIAFGRTVYNFLTRNFNKIRVGRLPRKSIDRLRAVRRADLDSLGVLAELRADAQGVLQNVEPGPNLDPECGNRVEPGVVQIGLKSSEIDAMALRIEKLLERVDCGDLSTF